MFGAAFFDTSPAKNGRRGAGSALFVQTEECQWAICTKLGGDFL